MVINNPHPDVARTMPSTENKISWYRIAFQIPLLPEWVARLFNWSVVTKMLRDTAAPGAFPENKLALYRSAWDRDGAFRTMVNWYRANHSSVSPTAQEQRVKVPTLLLLTPQDAFIPSDLVRASLTFLDDGRLLKLEQGTHWVIQEHPEVIAREVTDFCKYL